MRFTYGMVERGNIKHIKSLRETDETPSHQGDRQISITTDYMIKEEI